MDPIYLSIQLKETGDQIKNLIKARGYTVRDVQGAMGFENPQAIYKWMAGRTLPSLDNLIILSRILHTKMEDILVIDGDVVFLNYRFNDNVRIGVYNTRITDAATYGYVPHVHKKCNQEYKGNQKYKCNPKSNTHTKENPTCRK